LTRARLPAWSADGRSAYYARWVAEEGDVEAIVRREVATGSVEELYRAEGMGGFAVAPDETELAVIRRVPGVPEESHLLVVELETGEERELVRVSAPDALRTGPGLSWSPDGMHILYLQSAPDSDGSESLRVVAREGGSPAVIPTDGWVTRPRVHPDGRRIAVVGGANRWEVWTMENLGGVVEDR
jgi:Tol biopolymer transport system component